MNKVARAGHAIDKSPRYRWAIQESATKEVMNRVWCKTSEDKPKAKAKPAKSTESTTNPKTFWSLQMLPSSLRSGSDSVLRARRIALTGQFLISTSIARE